MAPHLYKPRAYARYTQRTGSSQPSAHFCRTIQMSPIIMSQSVKRRPLGNTTSCADAHKEFALSPTNFKSIQNFIAKSVVLRLTKNEVGAILIRHAI